MDILIGIYIFVIGLCFGSFALAMTDRMKAKKDWVKGRSECDKCRHKLGLKDLVPLASWLSTGGKCRYCHKRLSKAYPLTELACGSAFVMSYIFVPYELDGYGLAVFGLWLLALVIMTSLIVFDLRWFLLPNKLVYPLQIIALIHWIIIIINN